MQRYEYKVVPAPTRGEKAKGVKGAPARFAHALTALMNEMGRDGWDYLRSDTLPCEERQGLTGKTTVFQNMLVFRRVIVEAEATGIATPEAEAPAPAATPEEVAARAAASLGVAPADEGNAPALGPARADTEAPRAPAGSLAAE